MWAGWAQTVLVRVMKKNTKARRGKLRGTGVGRVLQGSASNRLKRAVFCQPQRTSKLKCRRTHN